MNKPSFLRQSIFDPRLETKQSPYEPGKRELMHMYGELGHIPDQAQGEFGDPGEGEQGGIKGRDRVRSQVSPGSWASSEHIPNALRQEECVPGGLPGQSPLDSPLSLSSAHLDTCCASRLPSSRKKVSQPTASSKAR